MAVIAFIVNSVIQLYIMVLFVTVIASWLVAFGVVNRHNQFVDAVLRFCHAVTEPLLRPVRNMLPSLGGIDLAPIVVFIGLWALQVGLNSYVFTPAISRGF